MKLFLIINNNIFLFCKLIHILLYIIMSNKINQETQCKSNLHLQKLKNIKPYLKGLQQTDRIKNPGYSSPQLIRHKSIINSTNIKERIAKESSFFPMISYKKYVTSHLMTNQLDHITKIKSIGILKNIRIINGKIHRGLDKETICNNKTLIANNNDNMHSNENDSCYKENNYTNFEKGTESNIKVNLIRVEKKNSVKNKKHSKTTGDIKNNKRTIDNSFKSNNNNYNNNNTEKHQTISPLYISKGEIKKVFRNIKNNTIKTNNFNPILFQHYQNNNLHSDDNNNIITTTNNENAISKDISTLRSSSPQEYQRNNIISTQTKSTTLSHQHITPNAKPRRKKSLPSIYHKPPKEIKYTYCVHPGNNSKLIITCMQTRPKWNLCETELHSYANLYWTPISANIRYHKQENINCQYVNHIQNHHEISNKMHLFLNLLTHCEQNNINLFSFFPLTIIFPLSEDSFFDRLRKFSSFYKEYPSQQINTNTYNSYFPLKFNKKAGSIQTMTLPSTHYAGNNTYLIKPVNFNRGRYIKVIDNLDVIISELQNLHRSKSITTSIDDATDDQSKHKTKYVIVQKYIERPLTYKSRKFDIRIWVLMTFKGDVFVFKEGHLKATSSSYDVSSNDLYVHLTNYSVQKSNMNFSKEEIGNEISFKEFQRDLDRNSQCVSFRKEILSRIYEIILISFNAVKNKLIFYERKKCFEIFGYDFLIDIEFNPFLIEINTNPGLEESSPLIKMLVPRMIDDAFRLTIDEEFPRDDTNDKYRECSPFKVDGYSNYDNMWMKLNK